jgi:hypothetical protein
MIGVTTAGYKAQQMNSVISAKTAEKRLQFGVSKCKSMLISKAGNEVIKNPILVDEWNVKHSDGSSDLVESYEGKVAIDETEEQKYLGFIISSKGDNLKNITAMKNKSVWIIRKIFNRLQSLSLKKYFFECAILFLNIMLRNRAQGS